MEIGSGAEGGDLLLAVDVLRVTLPAVTCGMRSAWGGVAELAALQQFQDVLAWNCSPLASQGEFPPGLSVKRASLQHDATAPPVIPAALGKPWCLPVPLQHGKQKTQLAGGQAPTRTI